MFWDDPTRCTDSHSPELFLLLVLTAPHPDAERY
jgi:hypothetical protein